MAASIHGAGAPAPANQPAVVVIAADRQVKKDGYLSPLSTASLACTEKLLFGNQLTAKEFSLAETAGLLPRASIDPKTKDLEITLSPKLCEHMQSKRDASEEVTSTSDKGLKELSKYGTPKQLADGSQQFRVPADQVKVFFKESLKLHDAVFTELEKLKGKFPEPKPGISQQQASQQKTGAVQAKVIQSQAPKHVLSTSAPNSALAISKIAAGTLSAGAAPALSLATKKIVQTNAPDVPPSPPVPTAKKMPPPLPSQKGPPPLPSKPVSKASAQPAASAPVASGAIQLVGKIPTVLLDRFKAVDSSTVKNLQGVQFAQVAGARPTETRSAFMKAVAWEANTPVLSHSKFVSREMCSYLMAAKKDSAIGEKYTQGDKLTNMEGALHTYMTPIVPITMSGDYKYDPVHKHTVVPFAAQQGRQVVLSAAIHPDFEKGGTNAVMLPLCEITATGVKGAPLPAKFADPKTINRDNETVRKEYDTALKEHLIYQLTAGQGLPKLADVVKAGNKLSYAEGQALLEKILSDSTIKDPLTLLKGKCIEMQGKVISLEVLYNSYLEQIRNEFSVLDATLPQGYVYSLDPPRIFARQLDEDKGPIILNRLQALAMRQILPSCKNLKKVAFNDFADKGMIALMKKALPKTIAVQAKSELFDAATGHYKGDAKYALVIHNNSDAFGQNIEHEGAGGSIDGAIGSFSDAAKALQRKNAAQAVAVTTS